MSKNFNFYKMMELSRLFGSPTRVAILTEFFSLGGGVEVNMREIARRTDKFTNSVNRELKNLEELGILRSRETRRERLYSLKRTKMTDNLSKFFVEKIDDDTKTD